MRGISLGLKSILLLFVIVAFSPGLSAQVADPAVEPSTTNTIPKQDRSLEGLTKSLTALVSDLSALLVELNKPEHPVIDEAVTAMLAEKLDNLAKETKDAATTIVEDSSSGLEIIIAIAGAIITFTGVILSRIMWKEGQKSGKEQAEKEDVLATKRLKAKLEASDKSNKVLEKLQSELIAADDRRKALELSHLFDREERSDYIENERMQHLRRAAKNMVFAFLTILETRLLALTTRLDKEIKKTSNKKELKKIRLAPMPPVLLDNLHQYLRAAKIDESDATVAIAGYEILKDRVEIEMEYLDELTKPAPIQHRKKFKEIKKSALQVQDFLAEALKLSR